MVLYRIPVILLLNTLAMSYIIPNCVRIYNSKSYINMEVEVVIPRVGGKMPDGKRPDWFRVPAPGGKTFLELQAIPIFIRNNVILFFKIIIFKQKTVKELKLHTVCEEAQCPNIGMLLLMNLLLC